MVSETMVKNNKWCYIIKMVLQIVIGPLCCCNVESFHIHTRNSNISTFCKHSDALYLGMTWSILFSLSIQLIKRRKCVIFPRATCFKESLPLQIRLRFLIVFTLSQPSSACKIGFQYPYEIFIFMSVWLFMLYSYILKRK